MSEVDKGRPTHSSGGTFACDALENGFPMKLKWDESE